MSFFFFYQNRRPRSFEHKPIYYDPQQDKRMPEDADPTDQQARKEKLNFQQGTTHLKRKAQTGKQFAASLLVVVIVLLLLILFVFLASYLFLM